MFFKLAFYTEKSMKGPRFELQWLGKRKPAKSLDLEDVLQESHHKPRGYVPLALSVM